MLLLTGRYFCLIIISNLHAFHVSVSEIYHNSKTQSLEISMKIFIDDLELAVQGQGNAHFKLVQNSREEANSSILKKYISDRFKIEIDSNPIELEMVGYEVDDNALLCYFESKKIKAINKIEFDNSIITEVYDDQINLIHFQYQGQLKSFQTTKENSKSGLNTSGW